MKRNTRNIISPPSSQNWIRQQPSFQTLRISNLSTVNLPPFLDDIFVFSDLRRTQFVSKCGRIFCTTGEEGSDKKVVARTALAEQGALLCPRPFVGWTWTLEIQRVFVCAYQPTKTKASGLSAKTIDPGGLQGSHTAWRADKPEPKPCLWIF